MLRVSPPGGTDEKRQDPETSWGRGKERAASSYSARMKKIFVLSGLLCGFAGVAHAEWSITNKDNGNYELNKACGSSSEAWSIAGGVTHRYSIPAGATSCTITVKNNGSSCTVRDNEGCVITSGRIAKQ